ncbi:MAG: AEC family transporter [Oscillospiraceae bacterium]|nr:AEC family transporter [Oscillospiraceae bacterium]
MEQILRIAQIVVPILTAVVLGMLARRKELLSEQDVQGMQQFVMKFGLPCVIFNSCLTADIGAESLSSMALILPSVLLGTLWAFRARKAKYPYHNLPQLFCAQETGMLGIPLFLILFGADQAYRMGVLDIAQALTAHPTIAILAAATEENPSARSVVKKVLTSPLVIMALLGLTLNFTGAAELLDEAGILKVLTESTGFLGQPVSALMIFAVGYNFSMDRESRGVIFRLSVGHFLYFALWGAVIQGILFLIPGVDAMTRWAMLLYTALPASYLAPTLGRSREDYTVASGVCSVLTIPALLVFCIIAAFVS